MFSKTNYQLEYVYTKAHYRRSMWWYVAIWVALRIVRAILFLTVGITFLASIPASLIFWGSGLVFGLAIMTIIIYRRSVPVDDLEEERQRLSK